MIFSKNSKVVRSFSRVISLLLIPTFLLSGITFATPQEKSPSLTMKGAVTNPDNVVIPRELGLVKSKFNADTGMLVVHIQDAHCNYEAQSNIVKILENLIKNYGLKVVAVEGADGNIDTSWFKAFPDDAVRKEVADYFMKKGEITGPEFLSITTDYPIKLFGAETRAYYLQNLNAFTSSYPLKAETEKYFNTIKSALNKLKEFIYNDDLKLMDAKDAEYESKKLPFNEYVRFLQAEAEKNKINLREYDNLFKLVSVLIYEKKIDFSVTDKERTDLIDDITKKLSKEGVTQLVGQSISFKLGKISSADYYNYLKNLASANAIDLAKTYPNLYNYIIYNSVYSKIENEKLFRDLAAVEGAIKEKLFRNDDQRALEKLSRHIDILIGLVNIKLLNGDFDYYKEHKEEFTVEAFSDFIQKKAAQFGLSMAVEPPADAVTKSVSKLEDFYAIAIKRNEALVGNTLGEMKRADQRIAVLVTGGFHSEGIAKLLEKEGISYMVVCPSITKDVPSPYIQVLTNQRTSFEDIVMGAAEPAQQGMLAPASIAWAVGLKESELRKIYQETAPAAGSSLEGTLEGRVLRVKAWWLTSHLTKWMNRAFRYANGNLHRLAQQENVMRDAYVMALDFRLAGLMKSGALTEARANEVKAMITGSRYFNEEFHRAFVLMQSRMPAPQVVSQAAAGTKAPDDSNRAKTIGAPLSDDTIDEAIRNSEKTLTIFQNGEAPAGVDPKYAQLVTIARDRLSNLPDGAFAQILKDAGVPADSPLATVFTRANLLRVLEKGYGKDGKGFTIKLVRPRAGPDGIEVPGIAMSMKGSNFGHYSTKNDAAYIPWTLMDLFIESLSVKNSDASSLIAADIAHELAEYAVLKLAYPDGMIGISDAKDISNQAHNIAQYLEVALAGASFLPIASKLGPRSALDDVLEDLNADYFSEVTLANKGTPLIEDAKKAEQDRIAALIERGKSAYVGIMGSKAKDEGYNLSLKRLGSVARINAIIMDSILSEKEREAVARLIAFGKGSVFMFWEDISQAQKRELVDQIVTLDLAQAQQYYKDFVVGDEKGKVKEGARIDAKEENLKPPQTADITQGDTPKNAEALEAGEAAFRAGEVAVLELAGGSGSRLGYFDPKIMFHASPAVSESLARMRARRIRALAEEYGKPVPWIIMTSDVTDKKIRKYFKERIVDGKYFGQVPTAWVTFVPQRNMPRMTTQGEFVLGGTREESENEEQAMERAKSHIAVGGFGHGDARDFVLSQTAVQDWLNAFGVKYVMMVNVDNAFLAAGRSVGYHILATKDKKPGTEYVSKLVVLKERPEESIGMNVLINNKDGVIEYNQVPADKPYLPFIYVKGNDKFILYKNDAGEIQMMSPDDFAPICAAAIKEKGLDKIKDGVKKWLVQHCITPSRLPDGVHFHYLGADYSKDALVGGATIWLRLGNLNTLIWTLSSFTDKEHQLHALPVVVDKPKSIDGYHPESGAYNPKGGEALLAGKFEVMAFHGFLADPVKGMHIIVDRAGKGREGGFAPIKEKDGVDTPQRAAQLLSEYDIMLLRQAGWEVQPQAVVELSPAFAFLDGRYLAGRLGENGRLGAGSAIFLSGSKTTIGKNFSIGENGAFKLNVIDEYNPNARVRIGDNVEVRASVAFTVRGSGQLIIEDGVVFEDTKEVVVNDGEIVYITKNLTKGARYQQTEQYARGLWIARGSPQNSTESEKNADWARAEEMVAKEFPLNNIFRIPMVTAVQPAGTAGERFSGGVVVDWNAWERVEGRTDMIRLKADRSAVAFKQGDVWVPALNNPANVNAALAPQRVGAIRQNGGALTAAEHGVRGMSYYNTTGVPSVNGAIAELIEAGKAYVLAPVTVRPGDLALDVRTRPIAGNLTQAQQTNVAALRQVLEDRGINLVIINGLRRELERRGVAPDLVFHPGIERRAIYVDEGDLLYLLSLDLVEEAITHELAHIKNPEASEEEIEFGSKAKNIEKAPSYNVRLALTLRDVAAQRATLPATNRRYMEGHIYDYTDVTGAKIAGYYQVPLIKFAKFGTSGVRWLVPGSLKTLAENYPETYQYIYSNGYTQEDFSMPNVGIIAKAIALYNLRKAQGLYAPTVGTTGDFARRLKEKGILLTYDNRPGNIAYAENIARILAAYGIKVTMVKTDGQFTPVPIPVTSLMVKREGFAGAITLTASHNGDQWNGIKFETEDGAPAMPQATNAIGSILNEEFRLTTPNYDIAEATIGQLTAKGMVTNVDAIDYYVRAVLDYMGKERVEKIKSAIRDGKVSLKYSAFYGSSGPVMKKLFEVLGLPADDIIETQKPSENVFVQSYEPTLEKLVKLGRTVKTAGQAASQAGKPTIVLGAAADNDADRFQVNEYNPETGQVEEYTPATLTAILGHYLVTSRGLTGQDLPWGRSFVSSTYQDYVAKLFGQPTIEQATGFKFSPDTFNKNGIIYSEESYGLSFNNWTLDKDGIMPALLALELVANTGKSLAQYNKELKAELKAKGLRSDFFFDRDDLKLTEEAKNKAVHNFRKFFESIRVGTTSFAGKTVVKLYNPAQYEGGLKFVLDDGSWVAFRSSGTEPIIRMYYETLSEKDSQVVRQELARITGLEEKPASSDMEKEKPAAPKKADITAAKAADAKKGAEAGKVRPEIYNKYVREDEEALRSTLIGIGVDEQRKKHPVILVYDTGIEPRVDTTHVARAGEVAINKYLNGMVVEVRGTGKALLEAVRVQAAKIGANYSVVTIAGDATLDEIRSQLAKEGKPVDKINDDLGTVINVQNPEGKYIPIIGLYDVALRIAYDLDKDAIVERLNRLALNPNGTPFTKDDLLKGVIRILPRIAPANTAEAVEAYKAAQQALQSL